MKSVLRHLVQRILRPQQFEQGREPTYKNLDDETITECNAAFEKIKKRVTETDYLSPDLESSSPSEVMVRRLRRLLKITIRSLLKAPSELDQMVIADGDNPYFQIINPMINAITSAIFKVQLASPLSSGKEEDREELKSQLEKNILSIAVNWLGICYATDESVVGKKIANSIRNINGSNIWDTWEQIKAVFEKLNDYVTKNNLQEELQTQIVKDENDGSFTIIMLFLGQEIRFRLPPPVFPEGLPDEQQTLPTN